MFYTEDGRQASSLEDLNGQTVEVAEAPVQRSQQKMAYARMMADRQSAGSSSGSFRHFFSFLDCASPRFKEGCNRGRGLSAAIKIGTPEPKFLQSGFKLTCSQ